MVRTALTLDVMVKESILQVYHYKPPGVYQLRLPMDERQFCKSLQDFSRDILVPRLKRRKVKLPLSEPDVCHQYNGTKGRGWYGGWTAGDYMFLEITRPQ